MGRKYLEFKCIAHGLRCWVDPETMHLVTMDKDGDIRVGDSHYLAGPIAAVAERLGIVLENINDGSDPDRPELEYGQIWEDDDGDRCKVIASADEIVVAVVNGMAKVYAVADFFGRYHRIVGA